MLDALIVIIMMSTVSVSFGQTQDETKIRDALESAASLLRQGDAADALSVLSPLDSLEPGNPWLWYYRGQARGRLGEPYKAMEAYDRALDELASLGHPDPPLAERIRKNRRDARRQVYNLSFQIGFAYDSNVTFRGGGTTGRHISGRGDSKIAKTFHWDYVPLANQQESIAMGVRTSQAWHFTIDEFDYQNYGFYYRYTRKINENWTFDLQYDYDFTYLDNESFLSNHVLSPRLTYRWPEGEGHIEPVETYLDYRLGARDFLFDTSPTLDRDGFANSFGLVQRFRVNPSTNISQIWDLYTGYRIESVTTQGSEFDRYTNQFYISLLVPTTNPWFEDKKLTAQFLASWEIANYNNNSVIDRRRRERSDLITTLGVIFSQQLVDDVEHGEWTLHAIFQWTDSDSNIVASDRSDPFTYDKIVAGVQLEWRF